MPTRQIGISPKVLAQAVVTIVAWVLGYFAIQLPPELSSLIALVLGAGAGAASPPGAVAHEHPPTASDDELDPNVKAEIIRSPPPA